jgi:hypothetical protein
MTEEDYKALEQRVTIGLDGERLRHAQKLARVAAWGGMGEEEIQRQITRSLPSRDAHPETETQWKTPPGYPYGVEFSREYMGSFAELQAARMVRKRGLGVEPIADGYFRISPEQQRAAEETLRRIRDEPPREYVSIARDVERSKTGQITNMPRIRLPQESSTEYAETVKRLANLKLQWEPSVPNLQEQWPQARDAARAAGMELHGWPTVHPKLTTWEWFSPGRRIVARVMRIQSPHDTGQICVAESDLLKIIAGTYDRPEDDLIAGCFLKPPRTTSLREDDFANRPTPWAPEVL